MTKTGDAAVIFLSYLLTLHVRKVQFCDLLASFGDGIPDTKDLKTIFICRDELENSPKKMALKCILSLLLTVFQK